MWFHEVFKMTRYFLSVHLCLLSKIAVVQVSNTNSLGEQSRSSSKSSSCSHRVIETLDKKLHVFTHKCSRSKHRVIETLDKKLYKLSLPHSSSSNRYLKVIYMGNPKAQLLMGGRLISPAVCSVFRSYSGRNDPVTLK